MVVHACTYFNSSILEERYNIFDEKEDGSQ